LVAMPVPCALCKTRYMGTGGLSQHVRYTHKLAWADYLKKLPIKSTESKQQEQQTRQGSPSPAESKALLEEFEKIAMNIITRPEVLNAIRNALKESEGSQGAQNAKEPTLPEGVEKLPEGAVKIGVVRYLILLRV
jgi:hypothetical protein